MAAIGNQASSLTAAQTGSRADTQTDSPIDSQAEYVEGEVIAVLSDDLDSQQREQTLEELSEANAAVQALDAAPSSKDQAPTIKIELAEGTTVEEAIAEIESQSGVAYAQPNYIYTLMDDDLSVEPATVAPLDSTADLYRDWQWALTVIKADEAAELALPNAQIEVAVIDTGVDIDHPDLRENLDLQSARDYSDPNNPTSLTGDVSYINGKGGHGTHVAGIIAAVARNDQGVSGTAVNNQVKVLPINVFYPDPNNNSRVIADTFSVVRAYDYLLGLALPNLKVVNLSLGGRSLDSAMELRIEQAKAAGILTVCAAGNDDSSIAFYPSDYDAVVSVTATTFSDAKASYSNHNRYKDISAPGGESASYSDWAVPSVYELGVLSTVPNDDYSLMIGTSMAAPHVSAAAAVLYSIDPSLTIDRIKDILYSTSTDLGDVGLDEYFGWGRLDLEAAVAELLDSTAYSAVTLSGETRYDTMEQIIQYYIQATDEEPSASDTVIIASGENYPDALAASGLAGKCAAPVLLTSATALSSQTMISLEALDPSRVLVLGGESAISPSVLSQIKQVVSAATLVRIAGDTRVETALEIYEQGANDSSAETEAWGDTAIVTTGYQFADALAIAPFAYRMRAPLFLTQSDGSIDAQVKSFLTSGAFTRVIVVGGNRVIPDTVVSELAQSAVEAQVLRWGGGDRYQTSAVIANNAVEEGVFAWQGVGFATGRDFPDALSASSLLGYEGYPLLLVDETESGRFVLDELLVPNSVRIKTLLFFGGSDVLPNSLKTSIQEIVDFR